ncbi:MAG: peptide deformylase [Planctomycetota bacterium]|jgi:peptide deformylase
MSVDLASLSIVNYPDPILRRRAEEVEAIDDEVRAVASRMIELMHEAEGVGLAAPQVALPWRLFVCRGEEEEGPEDVFINPELAFLPGELVSHEEGCLSLPDITAEIRRPDAVRLTARTLDGGTVAREASGFIARVWQHEFDHLNGVLIIDRMSRMDRLATRKALKSLEMASR